MWSMYVYDTSVLMSKEQQENVLCPKCYIKYVLSKNDTNI